MTFEPQHAGRFGPLRESRAARWSKFGSWDQTYFPNLVGLVLEELREDYCRMRLPWRPELNQSMGLVHGGAVATLIDTVVVPAIGSGYDEEAAFATASMTVNYLGALRREDAVAEGWIEQRGRSVVFARAEVFGGSSGRKVADGSLVYAVSVRKPPPPAPSP